MDYRHFYLPQVGKIVNKTVRFRFNYFRFAVLAFALAYGWSGYLPLGPDKVLRVFPEGLLSYTPSVVALFSLIGIGTICTRFGLDHKSPVSIRIGVILMATILTIFAFSISRVFAPEGDLAGDELMYASQALLFPSLFLNSSLGDAFPDVSGALFSQAIILGGVLFMSLSTWLIYRIPKSISFVIGAGSLTLAGVVATEIAGFDRLGYLDFYPTFLSAVVSVVGVSDFGFRFALYILLFPALVFLVQRLPIVRNGPVAQSLVLCAGWLSIPLVAHHLALVEVASVSLIAALLVVPSILIRNSSANPAVLAFLTLLVFMRLSSILYLAIYLVINAEHFFRSYKLRGAVGVVALMLAPYGFGILVGRPDFLAAQIPAAEVPRALAESIWPAIVMSVDLPGGILALGGVLFWLISRGRRALLELWIFLTGAMALFFVAPPFYIVGFPKYQAEWLPLLMFLGLVGVLKLSKQLKLFGVSIWMPLMLGVTLWNLYGLAGLESRNGDVNSRAAIDARFTYSSLYYREHFVLARAVDQSQELLRDWSWSFPRSNCLIFGSGHAPTAQTLAGFTVAELIDARELSGKLETGTVDRDGFSVEFFTALKSQKDVSCLVTSVDPDPEESRNSAIEAGWLVVQESTRSGSASQVFLHPQGLAQLSGFDDGSPPVSDNVENFGLREVSDSQGLVGSPVPR